ncbi:MAG: DUF4173 domain-containing protein [Flavobacteriales bacterium]|nr:DUF4173 domain-containing protein [Flavobacteriales bacterium]
MSRSFASLLLALGFAVFFYGQDLGINVLLYGALVAIVLRFTKEVSLSAAVIVPFLLATAAVAFHGNAYANVVAFAAFAVVSGHLREPRLDPVLSFALALPNFLFAPFRLLFQSGSKVELDSGGLRKFVSYVLIPFLFLLFFTALYAGSNPIFENMLQRIDWDFIRIDLIWVFVLGLIFSSVLFFYYIPPLFNLLYSSKDEKPYANTENKIDPEEGLLQNTWAVVMATLSALLLLVLAGDLYYRFILNELPEGLSLSSYLHRGIFSLIISILAAILLITFIFRRESTRSERITALLFMILNVFYLMLNADKNQTYILEYGLTMKRIGVYLYLTLTLVGIGTAIALILGKIDLGQIYRYNAFSVFYLLVLFACPDWSRIITKYNLSHIPSSSGSIDYSYLFTLPESNTDLLLEADVPDYLIGEKQNRLDRFRNSHTQNGFLSTSFYDHVLYAKLKMHDHGTSE